MPRFLRRAALTLLGLVLSLATVGATAAAGVAATMRDSFAGPATAVSRSDWSTPRTAPPGTTVVAVVAGTTGSVVGDVLMPYEVFARSSRFFVYTVGERRTPTPLSGGLRIVPEHTFADVDAGTAPRPDVVVVPAVVDPTGSREAPMRDWLTRRADRGAYVLGVCAGTEVLAATGLLDGRQATSFWQRLGSLRSRYRQVEWVAGERYVQAGRIVTTAGVTSGLVGALRMVELLAGPADAERIGRELAYPGWSLDASTRIPEQRLALSDLPYALNVAFPWWRPTVGIGLVDGVGELDVASVFEAYAGTSFAARTIPVAAGRTVTTRHGALLLAVPTDTAGPVDRLVVPGVDQPDPVLARWAAERRLAVTLPHADQAPGEFSLDPVLRDLAEHTDQATARATAKFTEYPARHLRLTGDTWPWRTTLLGLLTIAVAAAVALLPTATARLLARRRSARPAGVATADTRLIPT
ncbi:DJ-1/PfpI family protein [Micromonospora sp. KC213]|uniref:DJ-1/PfpI family protein n=1 Tax=Micromonospora sp. KC213 TaxID=2530378 RepID=UPI0010516D43|nr:DJ-1/PfpI family protein [Micromonospora sp. KC213]TDC44134.1 protein DJ-1 [Micromonospora sp. KC213]